MRLETFKQFLKKRYRFILGIGFSSLILISLLFLIFDPRLNLSLPTEEDVVKSVGESCFYPGSIVYREDFLSYFQLTHMPSSAETFLEEKRREGIVSTLASGEIVFHDEVCLGPLLRNHCQENYCYQHKIPFGDIPSSLWKGLIGVEDYRFLSHKGVDYLSILRALWADLKAMKAVQGGSTITQQLIKNLFLTNEKSLFRKIKEVFYSLSLESRYPKEDILAAYLNEVYWGGTSGLMVRGIYAASFFYFGKRPLDLDEFESYILVAMLQGPGLYEPVKHLKRLQERTDWVISKLLEHSMVAKEVRERVWSQERWLRWKRWYEQNRSQKPLTPLWYVSIDGSKRDKSVLNTFQQMVLINSVYRLEKRLSDKSKGKDIAVKALVTDLQGQKAPYEFYSKWERSLETAITEEKHQMGSVIKPLLYALYRELGRPLTSTVSTLPITLHLKSGVWTPKEAHGVSASELSVTEALQMSLNGATVRLAQEVGFDAVEKRLKNYLPDIQTPLKEFPAQLLGAVEVPMNKVMKAYTKLIREQCELDRRGEENVLRPLSTPEVTTVGKVLDYRLSGVSFFGKTGTTNKGVDNWYLAYDGRLVYLFWFGIESGREKAGSQFYGSTTAFRIFQDYFIHRGVILPPFFECHL